MTSIDAIEKQFNLKVTPIIMTDNLDALMRLIAGERIQITMDNTARRLREIILEDRKARKLRDGEQESEISDRIINASQKLVLTRQVDSYFEMMSVNSIISGNRQRHVDDRQLVCDECNSEMVIDHERQEAICSNSRCSACKKIDVYVAQVGQFGQENQKLKTGKFLPDRHLKSWLMHIQAKEDDSELSGSPDDPIGEKLIDKIRSILLKDREILRLVDPYKIRNILKRLDKTKLNKNISKIMKRLTGIGPPSLSDEIVSKVSGIFSRIVEIHERIHPVDKPNRNFYPYYIFKILELILPENDKETRRILFYIYLQANRTLSASDDSFRQILNEMNKENPSLGYKFIPTNRYQTNKFSIK